jgi:hypothetical protein
LDFGISIPVWFRPCGDKFPLRFHHIILFSRNRNPSVSGPDLGGLPSETLKSGSLEGGQSADRAERTVSRVSSPWLIAQMCRFKFSPERTTLVLWTYIPHNRGITRNPFTFLTNRGIDYYLKNGGGGFQSR